ncbi:3-isopropylmalate dehydratase small subunit [Mycobacterium sp. AZCC_0083]|uniref:3-isopropylmalate dehydratase small subunit n=1 Tax=Mycobacterium sp. AZCC_0083 TaxID=2735882 RepID=UPI00161649C2|nr:3-isopropylmalate dehydratase small subunit [Mycobacterium sp. AZCC_0083]MBB5164027.1 3-isopropylmalate/(R)-2-methylmalate dehydratase small subunit [Mycobacterium sp. AZCC_0083]
MQPFNTLTAIAIPLTWPDVNTDDIFPATGVNSSTMDPSALTDRTQMGRNAFAGYRYRSDGSPNPNFIMNQRPYVDGEVLIAGRNFGCGSSREMAVWALAQIGVRCIIAPSFGDIFHGNAIANGMLPVVLAPDEVETLALLACNEPLDRLTVNLEAQTISTLHGMRFGFSIGAYHRHMLLNGLDEIAATLERMSSITAFETAYHQERSWILEKNR